MRYLFLLVLLLLAACGGGGGGAGTTPPSIPIGSISGVAYGGLISNGTVSIYDYSSGSRGQIIAQTTTDGVGRYSASLQVESRPLLIEIMGGSYTEEAGVRAQVMLSTSHRLSAVTSYTTGSNVQASITALTHLASGLAASEIKKGVSVSAAIADANARVAGLVGVNILPISPRQISDPANASPSLTQDLRYGFAAAGVSMWTYRHAPTVAVAHATPYTSMDFLQLLYQDVSADGKLDGLGLDSAGAVVQLSFGTLPLSVDVYRLGLGVAMLQMANDASNKTGLTGSQILAYVQSFVSSNDLMFSASPPINIGAPVVSVSVPLNNTKVSASATVSGMVAAAAESLMVVDLLLDNVVVSSATNLYAPSFVLNTAAHPDGWHSAGIRATNYGGQTTTTSVSILISNVAPVVSVVLPPANARVAGIQSVTTSLVSVAGLTKAELLVDGVLVSTTTANLSAPSFSFASTAFIDGAHTIGVRVTDIGGLISTSSNSVMFANYAPTVNLTMPANNAWARKTVVVSGTASYTTGLTSADFLVDGIVNSTLTTNLTAPTFSLDTTLLTDGPHSIGVRVTDIDGLSTTSTITLRVDNTPPVMVGGYSGQATNPYTGLARGVVTDNYSGGATVRQVLSGVSAPIAANGSFTLTTVPTTAAQWDAFEVRVTDAAGNCEDYSAASFTAPLGAPYGFIAFERRAVAPGPFPVPLPYPMNVCP